MTPNLDQDNAEAVAICLRNVLFLSKTHNAERVNNPYGACRMTRLRDATPPLFASRAELPNGGALATAAAPRLPDCRSQLTAHKIDVTAQFVEMAGK